MKGRVSFRDRCGFDAAEVTMSGAQMGSKEESISYTATRFPFPFTFLAPRVYVNVVAGVSFHGVSSGGVTSFSVGPSACFG